MTIIDQCNNISILGTILFIKNIVKILCIVTPILLLLFLTIDFVRAAIESNEEKMDKVKNTAIKRILFALIVFFIPIIVNSTMNLLGNSTNFSACYDLADNEVVTKLAEANKIQEEIKKTQEEVKIQELIKKQDKIYKDLEKNRNIKIKNTNNNSDNSGNGENKYTGETYNVYEKGNISGSEAIAATAEALAWPKKEPHSKSNYSYSKSKVFNSWNELNKGKPTQAFMNAYDKVRKNHFEINRKYPPTRVGGSCDVFVGTVVKYSGYDYIGYSLAKQNPTFKSSSKWKKVSSAKRGDICTSNGHGHIYIYLGDNKIAEASYGDWFGRINKGNCDGNYTVWRATK